MHGAEKGYSTTLSGSHWCPLPPEQVKGRFSSCVYQTSCQISQDAGWKWPGSSLCLQGCSAWQEGRNQSVCSPGLPKPYPKSCPAPDPSTHILSLGAGKETPEKAAFPPGWMVEPEPVCEGRRRMGPAGLSPSTASCWPEALSWPLPSPEDPVICFWPWLEALGQAEAVQVDCCSPRSSQGPSETQPTPARARDGYK